MKKIKASFDQKDRIVCVTNQSCHEFYYQPVGSKEHILLFMTHEFSGSVFTYFRSKGRNLSDIGFSLTIKELYEFKEYHNRKLAAVMKRIPSQVEYVLRERYEGKKTNNMQAISRVSDYCYSDHDDDECAA